MRLIMKPIVLYSECTLMKNKEMLMIDRDTWEVPGHMYETPCTLLNIFSCKGRIATKTRIYY